MKQIAKWAADDGSEWNSADDANRRDELIKAVHQAMLPLGDLPKEDNCRFQNGHGYIQHSAQAVEKAKLAIHELAKPKAILGWWFGDQIAKHGKTHLELALKVHPSWHSRMLDGGHQPLGSAYYRFQCIDKDNREWGQPYFANNPDEAENIRLNPE